MPAAPNNGRSALPTVGNPLAPAAIAASQAADPGSRTLQLAATDRTSVTAL
jgi:hypothetical protein